MSEFKQSANKIISSKHLKEAIDHLPDARTCPKDTYKVILLAQERRFDFRNYAPIREMCPLELYFTKSIDGTEWEIQL